MTRKIYWGIAIILITLIAGTSTFLLLQNTDTQPEIIYKYVEPSKDNPPPAEPGYNWIWHHNHWDKVPINENIVQKADKNAKQIDTIILDKESSEIFDTDEYTSLITGYIDQQMHLYTDEYTSLIRGYIDHHMHLYPDCKEHNAVLKDARQNAKWILSDRIYSEISKVLNKESNQIDSDLAMIYYGDASKTSFNEDLSYYFNSLKTMSDDEKQATIDKLNTLLKKSDTLDKKQRILHENKVPYQKPSHTHE